MKQSDLLVQKLISGDEASFAAMVEMYQDMVYNTVLSVVQQEDDADDITQDVFVQVYQSVSSFKGQSKFSTWLYQVSISKALDFEKRKKRKKRFGFIQSLFGNNFEEERQLVEFNHPGIQFEKKELANGLFKALKKLPDNQRIAFTLSKMEGQSHADVAEIMQLKITAVESLMARAKANLKKELATIYKQQSPDF